MFHCGPTRQYAHNLQINIGADILHRAPTEVNPMMQSLASGARSPATPEAVFTNGDDEHQRMEEAELLLGLSERQPTAKKHGGAHEKQHMWTPGNTTRLQALIPLYQDKNGKTNWKELLQDHFKERTTRSARSSYCRFMRTVAKYKAVGGPNGRISTFTRKRP